MQDKTDDYGEKRRKTFLINCYKFIIWHIYEAEKNPGSSN